MRAMVLRGAGGHLEMCDLPTPRPAPGQVLVKVEACGVCWTDLQILDGDLAAPKLPLVDKTECAALVGLLGIHELSVEDALQRLLLVARVNSPVERISEQLVGVLGSLPDDAASPATWRRALRFVCGLGLSRHRLLRSAVRSSRGPTPSRGSRARWPR